MKRSFIEFYHKNYKFFLILPVFLLIFSLFLLFTTFQNEGVPIYRDISLKGGLSAVVETTEISNIDDFKKNLKNSFKENSFVVSQIKNRGVNSGVIIDTDLDEKELISYLTLSIPNLNLETQFSSNYISPELSLSFFSQTLKILIISFVLMSLVIFFYFRDFLPSTFVILSVLFDIIVVIGILNFFSFEFSIAGIGALLMLIGYSIDTDILLTNRVLKEEGENHFEKVFFAFKTGTLMSFTTLVAGTSALILTNSEIIFEIALILVIGILVDYISTWFSNAPLLLWVIEKRKKKLN